MRLLHIELQHDVSFSDEQNSALDRLSILISGAPGFIWKTFAKKPAAGQATGIYVFEDEFSAQLYSCRFALQMSALGIARIVTDIHVIESGICSGGFAGAAELLFSPSHAHWHLDDVDDLVA